MCFAENGGAEWSVWEMRLEIVVVVRYARNGGDFDIFLNGLIF